MKLQTETTNYKLKLKNGFDLMQSICNVVKWWAGGIYEINLARTAMVVLPLCWLTFISICCNASNLVGATTGSKFMAKRSLQNANPSGYIKVEGKELGGVMVSIKNMLVNFEYKVSCLTPGSACY